MRYSRLLCLSVLLVLFGWLSSAPVRAQEAALRLLRLPEGGIQPQVAVDGDRTVHVVYFKGDPASGDLFYTRLEPGAERFARPLQVNHQPGSAVAVGTIRGAQMAVGQQGRVHVVWNGSPKAKAAGHEGEPMLYARLDDAGTAFEPERDLITWASGLDGGGSVAADGEGNVYVVWQAGPHGAPETERAVYVAHSKNEGRSFAREKQVSPSSTGVCGCCGLKAHVDQDGALYVLYRGAGENVHRDMHLLVSRDRGQAFAHRALHPWEVSMCPMSSAAFAEGAGGVVAAWQTEEQVFFAPIGAGQEVAPVSAPGTPKERKHPALAVRPNGSLLLAWTEGTGWGKGGALAWQVYGAAGAPTAERGRAEGVPVWSLPAAFTDSPGRFVLVY